MDQKNTLDLVAFLCSAALGQGSDFKEKMMMKNEMLNSYIFSKLKLSRKGAGFVFFTILVGFGFSMHHASASTAIYRSVSPGDITDHNASTSATVAISGTSAIFSTDMPDNIGVGDVLQYNISGTYYLAFISGRTSSTVYTVQAKDGTTPQAASAGQAVSVYRAYTSLYRATSQTENTAIDVSVSDFDTSKNLVTLDYQLNIACYANGVSDDTANVGTSEWITSATDYLNIYTPHLASEVGTTQRHQGVWNTSYYHLVTNGDSIEIRSGFIRIDGLQINPNKTYSYATKGIYLTSFITGSPDIRISNNIIKAVNSYPTGGGISVTYNTSISGGKVSIWNNMIYGFSGGSGVYDAELDYAVYVYSNTVADCLTGFNRSSGMNFTLKDNISYGNTNDYVNGGSALSDYNLSDINGAPGANSKNSATVAFVNYSGHDYHLDMSDTGARLSGEDLSSESHLSFSTDIDGQTRTGTWDIGADETVSSDVTAPTISSFSIPSTSSSLTVSSITFTASDDTAVTGYCLAETDSSSSCSWSGTATTDYTFSSSGTHALYAFAKDAAENISSSSTDSVDITLPTYTIAGTVSGLTGAMVLQNNSTDDLSISVDGGFEFSTALEDASSYSVTVLTQPTGYTCSVTNGSGTISGANITNVGILCVENNVTLVTNTGVADSGFPVALTTSGETYRLSEDIYCDTTCFTVKNSDITLDLNGHTATFGTANNPGLLNASMEDWTNSTNLINWTATAGTVAQSPAQVWGNYDAVLSATAVLKSDPVTLNAGQTYLYYAMAKGNSADSYTISVRATSDDSILASTTISGDILNRAFAMSDGSIGSAENEYKPSVNTSVYLQIDCFGAYTKRLHVADIKPDKHFFITGSNYRNSAYYPDLSDSLFGGSQARLTVENGTISQGAGDAVKSIAIQNVLNVQNVNINMTGNDTTAVSTWGSFTLDTVSVDTASILNFNRMHPPSTFNLSPASTGTAEVKNCTLLNDPEQAIKYESGYLNDSDTHAMSIHDNVIRQREQVTEGYAVVLSGVANVDIYNNTINPYRGRGILLDSVANNSGYLDGTKNVSIHDNIIENIHEFITPEYGQAGLEAAGIRVRDWGGTNPPEGHRNLKIYDNTISGYVDSVGTHRSYGINISSQSANTTADIYNNVIDFELRSSLNSDWEADAISLQGAVIPDGGYVYIRNNNISGNVGFRMGGNDGSGVSNIDIYSNKVSTDEANFMYFGYLGPFTENRIYNNQLTNLSTTGYNLSFEDGTPAISNQYYSNNLITNSNSGGYEVSLNKDYSTSVMSCNNGSMDVYGGGGIGTETGICHDGAVGGYATAGVASLIDTTAPTITAFTIPDTATSLTVPISSFTATDDTAVTGYCLSETNDSSGCSWVGTTSADYTFASEGAKTLYAFAKDAANNVSTSSNDSVTITLPTYTISGTITGLSGSLTLQNNGGDDLTTSSTGSFTFSTSLHASDTYAVTITSEPTAQTCVLTHDSGTVGSSNVTDIEVACSNDPDTTAPTIDSFTLPANSYSLTTSVTLSASDNSGSISKYCLTETDDSAFCSWTSSAPTSYAFSDEGEKTLYAFAKDAANNISSSSSVTTVITLSRDQDQDSTTLSDIEIKLNKSFQKAKDKVISLSNSFKLKSSGDVLINGQVKIYKDGKRIKTINVGGNGSWQEKLKFNHDFDGTIKVEYFDQNGHQLDSNKFNLQIDTEKPVFTTPFPQMLNMTKSQAIQFTATDNNEGSYYKIKLLDKAGHILRNWKKQKKDSYFIPKAVAEKVQTILVRAYDRAGNYVEEKAMIQFVGTAVGTQESILTNISEGGLTADNCSYTVKPEDTLWSIAQQVYSDPTDYPKIIELNQDMDPNNLQIGETLTLNCESKSEVKEEEPQKETGTQTTDQSSSSDDPGKTASVWWKPWTWF